MITVQMIATPHHTGLTMHMLRDKHVIQLKEATLVRVLMCPTSIMIPFHVWERKALIKCAQSS